MTPTVQASIPQSDFLDRSLHTPSTKMVTTAHIATKHRSFTCIRQVAPVCTPSNTWFRGLMRVCPHHFLESSKRHLNHFSYFSMAHQCDQNSHTDKQTQCTLCQDMHSNSLLVMLAMSAKNAEEKIICKPLTLTKLHTQTLTILNYDNKRKLTSTGYGCKS